MPRRPSFQFYPADWLANNKLRDATFAERGLWIDILCVLSDSDDGIGLVRWDLRRLANRIGCHVNQLQSLVKHDILKGAAVNQTSPAVTYVDSHRDTHTVLAPQPGPIWFSSRMLIDEWKRVRDQANGSRGYPQPHPLTPHPPMKGKGDMKSLEEERGSGGKGNGTARVAKDAARLQFLQSLDAQRKPA
jgi:hypothetical protein